MQSYNLAVPFLCNSSEQQSMKTRMRNLTPPCSKFLWTTVGVSDCPIRSSQRILSTCLPVKARFLLQTFKKRLVFLIILLSNPVFNVIRPSVEPLYLKKNDLFVHQMLKTNQQRFAALTLWSWEVSVAGLAWEAASNRWVSLFFFVFFLHVGTCFSQIAGLYTSSPALGRYFSEALINAFR